MVNVVTSAKSPHDIINLGLTIKELQKEGRKATPLLVDEDPKQFWENLEKYVDKADKALIILDMPHPEITGPEKTKLTPPEAAIVYVPSELNAPNIEERQAMIESGISVIPERKSSECFVGDLTEDNKKWREISSIISLEQKPESLDKERSSIIKGIIDASFRSPFDAIQKIASNDMDFFRKLGAEKKPHLIVKAKNGLCEIENSSPENMGEMFETYFRCYSDPVAIKGAFNAIFTIKPTFFEQIAATMSKLRPLATFGKAKVLLTDNSIDHETLIFLLGKADRKLINLKIGSAKYVSEKTLERWLVGGKTSEAKEGGKTYQKRYHSLKDSYPDLQFVAADILSVPSEAYENTIALLHESGSEYQLIEEIKPTKMR